MKNEGRDLGEDEVGARVGDFVRGKFAWANFQVIVENFFAVSSEFDKTCAFGRFPCFLFGRKAARQPFVILEQSIRHDRLQDQTPPDIAMTDGILS